MSLANSKYRTTKRSLISVVVALSALAISVNRQDASLGTKGAVETVLQQDYSKFSHSSPREHAELMARSNCGSCHRRNDTAQAPRFPLHKDCTGCHLVQFTAANRASTVNPICTICHTSDGLNSTNPPTKSFPALLSFRAAFDHAQHLQGKESARPSAGCMACHTPARRGVAQSIPARLNAHQTCYECHSQGKPASDLSSCGVCHTLGSYSPTSTNVQAYRVSFSHSDHDAQARLTCTNCHTIKGRGLPQTKQVSSISPVQHLTNTRVRVL